MWAPHSMWTTNNHGRMRVTTVSTEQLLDVFVVFETNSVIKLRKIRRFWAFVVEQSHFKVRLLTISDYIARSLSLGLPELSTVSHRLHQWMGLSWFSWRWMCWLANWVAVMISALSWLGWNLQKKLVSGPWVWTALSNYWFQCRQCLLDVKTQTFAALT